MVRPVTDQTLLKALEAAPADSGAITDPTLLAALESAPVDKVEKPAPLRDLGELTLAEKAALWFNQATGGGAAQAGEAARGFVRGAAKPVVGAYQLMSRAVLPTEQSLSGLITGEQPLTAVDRAILRQEAKDQMLGYGTGNEMLGSLASPVNLGIAAATPVYRGAVGVAPKLAQFVKNIGAAGGSGIAMGATTPVVDPTQSFVDQKTDQMLTGGGIGAVAGGVGVPLIQGVGRGVGYVTDLVRGDVPKIQAANIVRTLLGEGQVSPRGVPLSQVQNVQRSIAGASDDITAAQAAKEAGVGSSEFQALGGMVAQRDTPIENYYANLARSQDAARRAALVAEAGGGTQAQVLDAVRQAQSELNKLTGPMREQALNKVNLVGRVEQALQRRLSENEAAYVSALQNQGRMQTEAAQQAVLATGQRAAPNQLIGDLPSGNYPRDPAIVPGTNLPPGAYPVPGMPRVPPRYTPNQARAEEFSSAADALGEFAAQRRQNIANTVQQLEGLGARGLQPLDSNAILANIQAKLQNPSSAGNRRYQAVLQRVADDVQAWSQNGRIDANALYAIRKNSVNDAVEDLLKGVDPKASAKFAASVLNDVNPAIDDALTQAGGTQWKNYLKTYSEGMQDIARTKMSGRLLELYDESQKKFLKTVGGDKPKEVGRIFGTGKTNLEAEMGSRIGPFKQAASAMERDAAMKADAEKGKLLLQRAIEEKNPNFRLPSFFNKWVTAANKGIEMTETGLAKKTVDQLVEGMKTGKKLSDLINTVPTSERNKFLRMLVQSERSAVPMTAAGMANQ